MPQNIAQNIAQNIIVELSNKTASNILSNGEFETILPEPIVINQGDVIQVKNVFIDTIQQSYDQIYIPDDIDFRLQVCYYEIDNTMHGPTMPDETAKEYSSGHYQPTPLLSNFEMYLCFTGDPANRLLVRNDILGKITKGLYTPQSLAIELTRQLAQLNYPQSGSANALDGKGFTIIIGADPANPGNFMSFSRLVVNIDPTQCNLDYNDYYVYAEKRSMPPEQWEYYTGAREVAVVYNDQGDNKFQFQYLHTPFYDDDGNMAIHFGNSELLPVTRDTGCMLLDMQPREFWTSLGFNCESMIPTFTDYTQINPQILYFDNSKMTTEGLLTIDDTFGAFLDNPILECMRDK